MKRYHLARLSLMVWPLLAIILALPAQSEGKRVMRQSASRTFRPVQHLLDLSGLAWMGGDTFLAVHDAKFPDEPKRVRVSLLRLPSSIEGIGWRPLRPRFPGRPSSDLESAARIPGTRKVLLAESGDDASGLDRIYLAKAGRRSVKILSSTTWSTFTDAFNVEATAVAATETGFLFIWAERAEGKPSTLIQWRELKLSPFSIGTGGLQGSASFTLPDEQATLYNRPIVGLDVDSTGRLYSVAAFDPNSDDGPFRAAVYEIGNVSDEGVSLNASPSLLSQVDGFKVESVALRETGDGLQLFVGTDDENYGGTLRPLPLTP